MEISTVAYAMVLAALGDCLWWLLADARLRAVRRGRILRIALALFMVWQLAYIALCMFWPQSVRRSRGPVPMELQVITYVWHIAVLPLSGLIGLVRTTRAWQRRPKQARDAQGARAPLLAPGVARDETMPHQSFRPRLTTRRQILVAAGAAIPPLAAISAGAVSYSWLNGLRTRAFTLTFPRLPREFDGMTLAQVSDTHIGKFFHADRLPALAETVNQLNADFIAFTGDLVDADLDDLPAGINFLRQLRPRAGLVICEGNHDLIEDRGEFERRLIREGLPLLVGTEMSLPFRGRWLQFLGVPWNSHDPQMNESVDAIVHRINREAFPILLAHHPHCFDAAAKAGLPLTISGHTHGGQIMLTRNMGAGALRFRYLSGLYQNQSSSLLVSNGVGNWFPVRINAPAELLHITLRSGR